MSSDLSDSTYFIVELRSILLPSQSLALRLTLSAAPQLLPNNS
jgi:hypothetical protein